MDHRNALRPRLPSTALRTPADHGLVEVGEAPDSDDDDDGDGMGDVVDADGLAAAEVVGVGEWLLCGVADGLVVRVGLDAYGVALDV